MIDMPPQHFPRVPGTHETFKAFVTADEPNNATKKQPPEMGVFLYAGLDRFERKKIHDAR